MTSAANRHCNGSSAVSLRSSSLKSPSAGEVERFLKAAIPPNIAHYYIKFYVRAFHAFDVHSSYSQPAKT